MNTRLKKEVKNKFGKDFFKLMNNAVIGKTVKNVRNHRDIKLVTTDKKRNQLVSELNYHTTKYFSKYLLAIEMIKTKAKMNKPLYLGMSILDISKTLMYEFWYDYIKPKYGDTAKLCYMDTDSFIIHYITEVFTKTLLMMLKDGLINLTLMRMMIDCFQQVRNKKVIGLFKNELGGKIMKEFCALRAKTYAYLMDDDSEKKIAKGITKYAIKRGTLFENYTDCLFNDKTILRSQ